MALKPCRECKRLVSERAEVCPGCGLKKPLQGSFERGVDDFNKAVCGCIWLVVMVVVAILLFTVVCGV